MSLPTCPQCHQTEEVFYSRVTSSERVLGILRIYPFRCVACAHRFFRFAKPQPPDLNVQPTPAPFPESFTFSAQPFSPFEGEEALPVVVATDGVGEDEVGQDSSAPLPSVTVVESTSLANGQEWMPFQPLIAEENATPAADIQAREVGAAWKLLPAEEDGQREQQEQEEQPSFWVTEQSKWILTGWAVLFTSQLVIGFFESPFLGLRAMWVNLLTAESLIGAFAIYLYLRQLNPERGPAFRAVTQMLAAWLGLLLLSDVCMLTIILPLIHGWPIGGIMFRAQAFWLSISCVVLCLAGVIGFSGYTWGLDRQFHD